MQKENSVIKNYILSPEKYLLPDKIHTKTIETYRYHSLLKQNMGSLYHFLLRK